MLENSCVKAIIFGKDELAKQVTDFKDGLCS
jgi:hypothetical protein